MHSRRLVAGLVALATLSPAFPGRAFAALSYGALVVTSEPEGALVSIDGQEMRDAEGRPEVTPWGPAEMPEGGHVVVLRHPRFRASPKEIQVQLQADLTRTVRVSWRPTNVSHDPSSPPPPQVRLNAEASSLGTGNVHLESVPPGASVFFNDVRRGLTPLDLRHIPEGEHQLRFELAGFPSQLTTVRVVGGQTIAMSHMFKRMRQPQCSWCDPRMWFGGLVGLSCALIAMLVRAVRTRSGAAPRPRTPTADVAGWRVLGDYEVDLAAPIATGGMAAVYRGRRLGGSREAVAIKIPYEAHQKDATFIDAFLREGRYGLTLHNENIVRIIGAEVDPRGLTYIAMEYVDGEDLAAVTARRLSVADAVAIAIQIGQALDYAHSKGIVHGDIKPSNVLVRRGRPYRIVLTDFGVASSVSQTSGAGDIVTGTPAYMAPEIVRRGAPTVATDLYAVGVVLYEMLTRQNPFAAVDGDSYRTMSAHMSVHPPSPEQVNPDTPPELAAIVMKLLAKQSRDRYGSAEELINALKNFARRYAGPA